MHPARDAFTSAAVHSAAVADAEKATGVHAMLIGCTPVYPCRLEFSTVRGHQGQVKLIVTVLVSV
jgi:hypothetical protein